MKSKGLFLTKYSSFATIATIFSLWLTVYLNEVFEETLGYFLILSVGILHGANDLKLLKSISKKKSPNGSRHLFRNYIVLVLLVGASFFILPTFALLAFVLLSSYHFGEQHWHDKIKEHNFIASLFYTIYGMLIFSLLFYLNPAETSAVISGITGIAITETHFEILFYITSGMLILIGSYTYFKGIMSTKLIEELFLLLVFFIIFRVASLVWAFAIYFILWHSLPSLLDQIQLLYGKPSMKSMKNYLASSFVYWILAIVGLALSAYFFGNDKDLFLPVFFSFLAAITLPHVLVMRKILH
ncbi:MAG: beta-carotene 15,15'-dioxygenase, Brp/Blh family [Flavobacteriaceae bacterium]|nr:beta-carotene 15,15'-dioxygenase, Brp/Blh family [Flavobacteriaceae bacterium]NNK28949.1 beta-carotene 15,15'-dioxygenase, Brp/Blh family [Flavobacteriaceae bacterium]NNL81386.1 beta-carotene 15,15'-dioxygenase, Brp/Blh family [Flavobacteriaceae bacterium]